MEKWYKNIYRRNLVDMHINDTSDEYLSRFSAEQYFKYLKTAHIQSPMIYLQSHTGLCNFETKVSKEHAYFSKNPNEIKKLINLCHKDGMKVVGYYSLIFNNQAIFDHPDWEMVNADGSTWRDHGQRYGLACPNNKEYREFLITQLKELKEVYPDVDALFFDMPYWEVTCHCDSCKEEWKKISQKEIPELVDWDNPEWKKYVKARQDWMGDFVKYVKKLAEEIYENKITVEFNFAAVVGCDWMGGSSEIINDYCEFTGGDLYGDLYNHSFVAKYYYAISKNQPFEYMTCRCNHSLREHTINKNDETLESEIMLTCMHHGASLIIDAINPDGTLDDRVANRIGKAFEKQIPYEKYMGFGKLYSRIAVYFDSKTQYEYHGRPYNKQAVLQVIRTLIENHIPFNIVANSKMDNLNDYDLLIAPSLENFDNTEIEKIIKFVDDGGSLYISGSSDERLLKTFFDGRVVGETFDTSNFKHVYKGYNEVQCYVYPVTDEYKKSFGEFNEKYPLPVLYKMPIVEINKGLVTAKVCLPYTDPDNNNEFASIHSNPPGRLTDIPAMIETNYGKGKVVYSVPQIEVDSRYNFKTLFINIIKPYIKQEYSLEASKYVELIIFKDENKDYINLFDLNFANDLVKREFELTVPTNVTKAYELITGQNLEIINNKIKGTFEKYLSLVLEK